jgi:hypothetical protein
MIDISYMKGLIVDDSKIVWERDWEYEKIMKEKFYESIV